MDQEFQEIMEPLELLEQLELTEQPEAQEFLTHQLDLQAQPLILQEAEPTELLRETPLPQVDINHITKSD